MWQATGGALDNIECEIVGFRVVKGAGEPRPLFEDKPWISKHNSLFVTDVLRANLPRVLYVQGLDALEEPLSDRAGANPL